MEFKVFGLYDSSNIVIEDVALRGYLNVEPRLLLKSQGKNVGKFGQSKSHIVERIAQRISVPGHVGKKHKIVTGWNTGGYRNNIKIVLEALEIIEKKTKENPIQVVVRAIERASPRDEITTIEYGGARYPQAVDVSPLRRINLAIRWIVQGAYQKSFGKKKKMAESLANEIMLAADENMEGYALQKKNEAEKQADAAR